ncbi:unnamed protein product, partial [Polarella glacialis]
MVADVAKGGSVDLWNDSALPAHQVRREDLIVRVGEVVGDLYKMLKELQHSRAVRIAIFRRPAGSGPLMLANEPEVFAQPVAPQTRSSPPAHRKGATHGAPQSQDADPGPIPPGQVPNSLRFEVVIQRSGARLGIEVAVAKSSVGNGLLVEQVGDGGLVDRWNKTSTPPYQVQSGDLILQVNDVSISVSASRMVQEFARDTSQVRFVVE